MRLLLLAVVAAPILAFWPQGPDEWSEHVRKACESSRFGIRLAAAKRVADGGDAAVTAIQAYEKANGRNALPSSLVDAIADTLAYSNATNELLKGWATDTEFYWRSSAMRGLALRAGALAHPPAVVSPAAGEPEGKPAPAFDDASLKSGEFFDPYVNDPAWLMRTHARFGSALVGRPIAGQSTEADPRALVRLTRLLLDEGQLPPLQPLIEALADQRTFLGIPWGQRLGQEANKALHNWLAKDYPEVTGGDRDKSTAAIMAAAQANSGQQLTQPKEQVATDNGIVGGFEIASCKFGDQFVQWTADGTVFFGIDGARTTKLPADKWQELLQQRTAITLDGNAGVVVCDKLQLVLVDTGMRVDVAPESLPNPASEWLKRLTQTLEEANETERAANLRRGLGQFEGR